MRTAFAIFAGIILVALGQASGLTGQIVDERSHAVEGAKVCCQVFDFNNKDASKVALIYRAVTGQDGHFNIEDFPASHLTDPNIPISIQLDNGHWTETRLKANGATCKIEDHQTSLSVKTVNDQGLAIPGIPVHAFCVFEDSKLENFYAPQDSSAVPVQTDSNGEAVFSNVPVGSTVYWWVEGWTIGFLSVHADQIKPYKQVFQLKGLSTLSGTVRRNGLPVPGVKVSAVSSPPTKQPGISGLIEGVSDVNGHYVLRIKGDSVRVFASNFGDSPQFSVPIPEIAVRPGSVVSDVDVNLINPAVVRGQLLDQNQKPIAKALLFFDQGLLPAVYDSHGGQIETDENGYFEGWCLPGDVRVRVFGIGKLINTNPGFTSIKAISGKANMVKMVVNLADFYNLD